MLDGSLAEFSAVNDVQKIGARVLLVNGVNEGSDHEESIRIFKLISDCTHVVFEGSTHFAHFEERAKFMGLVKGFLESRDIMDIPDACKPNNNY